MSFQKLTDAHKELIVKLKESGSSSSELAKARALLMRGYSYDNNKFTSPAGKEVPIASPAKPAKAAKVSKVAPAPASAPEVQEVKATKAKAKAQAPTKTVQDCTPAVQSRTAQKAKPKAQAIAEVEDLNTTKQALKPKRKNVKAETITEQPEEQLMVKFS